MRSLKARSPNNNSHDHLTIKVIVKLEARSLFFGEESDR